MNIDRSNPIIIGQELDTHYPRQPSIVLIDLHSGRPIEYVTGFEQSMDANRETTKLVVTLEIPNDILAEAMLLRQPKEEQITIEELSMGGQ